MLVGEERNIESKTASFFCVDHSGTLWKGKNFGEQWWTGIDAVHRGVLFLHGYATPDLPGRKGITAVDCATGGLLWKNPDVTLESARAESVFVTREALTGPLIAEMDYRTGALRRELERGESAARQVPQAPEDEGDAEFPESLSDEDNSPLALFARKFSGAAAPGCPVEYSEHGASVVIVYYDRENQVRDERRPYRRVLNVVERTSGVSALEVILDQAVALPDRGAFLIQGDTLYFVRGRKTLTAVQLRQL